MEMMDDQKDKLEFCPYIERMGVCLEPAACFLCHRLMNVNAKEFVPNFGKMSLEEKDPGQIESDPERA